MIQALANSLDEILIGAGIGVVIGLLGSISRRLLMIWSVLSDIERNTRNNRRD